MKYSLRSLMLMTLIGPPVLAVAIRFFWMLSGSEDVVLLGKCLACLIAAVFVGFMVSFWVGFFGQRLTP
jgi:hypothetical protein